MRRRVVLGAVLLSAVAGAVTFIDLSVPPPRINPAQYDRIREGMTLAEVEGIIGGSPGSYPPNALGTRVRLLAGSEFGGDLRLRQAYWSGTRYEIGVLLDHDERVVAKQLTKISPPPDWVDNLFSQLAGEHAGRSRR